MKAAQAPAIIKAQCLLCRIKSNINHTSSNSPMRLYVVFIFSLRLALVGKPSTAFYLLLIMLTLLCAFSVRFIELVQKILKSSENN